jgi:hypothetical protein
MYNKMKLKPFVIPTIYGIAAFILVLSVFFLVRMNNNNLDDNIDYVDDDTIDEDDNNDEPVVSTDIFFLRPYNDTNIGIFPYT